MRNAGLSLTRHSRRTISVLLLLFTALALLPGCSSINSVQPAVRNYVARGQYVRAMEFLEESYWHYSGNNELLLLLNQGIVCHYADRHAESVDFFQKAKREYDLLYTKSVTKMAASWLFNDETQPYYGEDFERAMINVFQALNFVKLGQWQDALVEARDMDALLRRFNAPFAADEQNTYTRDAFAHWLMGILYETYGGRNRLDDAYIEYLAAVSTYEPLYAKRYGVATPALLKEMFLSLAKRLGKKEFEEYSSRWGVEAGDLPARADEAPRQNSALYVILYAGQAPAKMQDFIAFPTLEGEILRVSFPTYGQPEKYPPHYNLQLTETKGETFSADCELANDITAIAFENLRNRRMRVLAKAAARPAFKYWLMRTARKNIEEKYGDEAALWFKYLGNLYLFWSEKADLRSWQTLPGRIYIGRLSLPAGTYSLGINRKKIIDSMRIGDHDLFLTLKINP